MGWLEEGTICGPKTVNLGRGWVNGVHFPHRAFQPLPLPFDPLMKTRRHFLRGSSALIALPALESIGFTAFAAPRPADLLRKSGSAAMTVTNGRARRSFG